VKPRHGLWLAQIPPFWSNSLPHAVIAARRGRDHCGVACQAGLTAVGSGDPRRGDAAAEAPRIVRRFSPCHGFPRGWYCAVATPVIVTIFDTSTRVIPCGRIWLLSGCGHFGWENLMRARLRGTKLYFDVEGCGLVPDGDVMREKPWRL